MPICPFHLCVLLFFLCSFVELSRKEEDCVLLQCREKNQLCVAKSDITIHAIVFTFEGSH